MFQGLEKSQLEGAIESLLFVSSEPVSPLTLANILDISLDEVEEGLSSLKMLLASGGRGVQLQEVAGGWHLSTHPDYHDVIETYIQSWDRRTLSQAALETLAIVAYTQPVTRADISEIRGVNSDSPINSLLEKKLLREAGVAESAGNPILYATSRTFLEKFGLSSIADLPDLQSFAPDEDTRKLLLDRLSFRKSSDVFDDLYSEDNVLSPDFLTNSDFNLIDDTDLAPTRLTRSGRNFASECASYKDEAKSPKDLLLDSVSTHLGLTEKIDLSSLKLSDDD